MIWMGVIAEGDSQLIMALWCHMATLNWVNIGSGNHLLPGGTKALCELNVDLSSEKSHSIHQGIDI